MNIGRGGGPKREHPACRSCLSYNFYVTKNCFKNLPPFAYFIMYVCPVLLLATHGKHMAHSAERNMHL